MLVWLSGWVLTTAGRCSSPSPCPTCHSCRTWTVLARYKVRRLFWVFGHASQYDAYAVECVECGHVQQPLGEHGGPEVKRRMEPKKDVVAPCDRFGLYTLVAIVVVSLLFAVGSRAVALVIFFPLAIGAGMWFGTQEVPRVQPDDPVGAVDATAHR